MPTVLQEVVSSSENAGVQSRKDHSNIGSKYVCKDGPVFRFEQIQALPEGTL